MAVIFIENKPYEVEDGQSLLSACLSLGFNIPYFCWHPAMHSVGACRQCAVKQFRDEKDTRGFIVMSCMTAICDGMRISIDDPEVKQFRASIIEFLMANHPHDCPVCDEGGECHLQDMTVLTGHVARKYPFKKRTYRNQNLGPFINHELNRCIQCYRCVRFYRDYAGGRDLNVFGIHQRVYFGRYSDGALESEFAGNLVEVCPTGVFTDKSLKEHYTRKWDLQTAPSICVHCSVGCNTIPGERYGTLRRIRNRFNYDVNGYFLCDRGRYGYGFVNGAGRIRSPLMKGPDGKLEKVSEEASFNYMKALISDGSKIIGIGSPRASLESNFALRELVGAENFSNGLGAGEGRMVSQAVNILQRSGVHSATLRDVAESDAVLILGENVCDTSPMTALAIRQSIRQKAYELTDKMCVPRWNDMGVRQAAGFETGPLYIAGFSGTRLDDAATETYRAAPDDIARLGFAVANMLDPESPPVPDLHVDVRGLASRIAADLNGALRPLVVTGVSCPSVEILQAAANVALALKKQGKCPKICVTLPECDTMGVALMGGCDLDVALDKLRSGEAGAVLILENDVFRRIDKTVVEKALEAAKQVVVFDHTLTATAGYADMVAPVGAFAETTGTFVNHEGRAQKFYEVMNPDPAIKALYKQAPNMAEAALKDRGKKLDDGVRSRLFKLSPWKTVDDVEAAVVREFPVFQEIAYMAPPSAFRISGLKVARQSHRYSGRTAMNANISVHEHKPPEDVDTPLAFSMEGYQGRPPASVLPRFWAPHWNSDQAVNKFQSEVGGPLRGGDPGKRLMEPSEETSIPYFQDIPAAFQKREGQWLVVPFHEVFGSEELSALSPPVMGRIPKPYLALNAQDAGSMGLKTGSAVELRVGSVHYELAVKIEPAMAQGLVGLPVGLKDTPWVELPAWGQINVCEG